MRYQLLTRVFLVLFVTVIVLGIFGISFLHRVAGPVYRLHRVFLRINDGEVAKIPVPLRVREGDFLQETVAEIDRMVMKMQFEANKSKLICQKLDQILKTGSSESISQSVREIQVLLNQEMPQGRA